MTSSPLTRKPTAEVCIALNKRKLIYLFIGSIVFLAGGAWLWAHPLSFRFHELSVNGSAVALIVIFFSTLCAILALKRLFDGRPGLIVDSLGLVDNSGRNGRIAWEEIVGFRVVEIVPKQRILVVDVTDPQKYIRCGGPLRQVMQKVGAQFTGSPINISAAPLRMDFDEMVDLIGQMFERHRKIAGPRTP
jgi:hypothetical protein